MVVKNTPSTFNLLGYFFLMFLFLGVPLIVFIKDYFDLHPGLATVLGFVVSMLFGLFFMTLFSRYGGKRR